MGIRNIPCLLFISLTQTKIFQLVRGYSQSDPGHSPNPIKSLREGRNQIFLENYIEHYVILVDGMIY